ncbi:myc target protein 1 [Pelodytes ibericus]
MGEELVKKIGRWEYQRFRSYLRPAWFGGMDYRTFIRVLGQDKSRSSCQRFAAGFFGGSHQGYVVGIQGFCKDLLNLTFDVIVLMLKSFGLTSLILSFTVSVVIGLTIGGIIWCLFRCLSRRRASASISPRMSSSSSRRPRTSSHNHALNRSGFYRNSTCERRSNLSLASLTFQRQTSQEQADPFTRKPSFRASTFHPFLQCPPLTVEADSQVVTLPRTSPTLSSSNLGRPEFHWSNNSLRLGQSTQTPPPAYESIIKAFPDS